MSDTLKAKLQEIHRIADAESQWHHGLTTPTVEARVRMRTLAREALALLSEAEAPRVADLDDVASDLWQELCEGDGAHSEQLDKALILKHLRRVAPPVAAAPAPPVTCATCRHWDCPTDGSGSWCQRPKSPMEFMAAPGDFACSLHEPAAGAEAGVERPAHFTPLFQFGCVAHEPEEPR